MWRSVGPADFNLRPRTEPAVRIIFAGTPDFARVALERLHASGFEIALVLTQPDRPAGRGLKLQASPVKQFALAHGIPVAQPRSLRLDGKFPEDAAAARDALLAARAEAMVVAAYGLILPQWVLDLPVRGCFNIHASLLPRWRGAAPIHRAIEAGDAETGITIMQMDAGLDTGDMLFMHTTPITGRDTTATLHDRLADLGGKLIVLALNEAAAARLAGDVLCIAAADAKHPQLLLLVRCRLGGAVAVLLQPIPMAHGQVQGAPGRGGQGPASSAVPWLGLPS